MKNSFALKFESTLKSLGGAVTIDGLHLKLQGRHYYDLTIHHMNIHKKAVVTEGTEFTIKTTTILFLEGPEKPTASNIIQLLDTNLQQQYKITYGDIAKDFTFVTDGAAVMANVGGSSVSLRLARRDQRWMRCFAHVLSKVMEKAMLNCKNDPVLIKIHTDFKMMKRVVENSKRVPWNHMLPNGYRLIQEVDTRFGTHYLVAQRFLKSATKVQEIIRTQNYTTAVTHFDCIKTQVNRSYMKFYPLFNIAFGNFRELSMEILSCAMTGPPSVQRYTLCDCAVS